MKTIPSSEAANQAERGLYTRWSRYWAYLAYLMVGIGLVLSWSDSKLDWPGRLGGLALALAWSGWYWLFVIRISRWKRTSWRLTISFLFAIGVATALSFIHPAFLLLLFSFYGLSFGCLPIRRAIVMMGVLSVSLAARFIAFSGGLSRDSLSIILSFGLSAFFSVLLGLWVDSIIRQSRDRQRMIEELEAARAGLAQAERQAGVQAERQRLAGEIHDTLAQGFTSIVLHLEAAEQVLENDPAAVRRHLAQARSAARDGLGEARRFVWALQPELLERKPLGQALQEVTRRWSAESDIPATLALTGAPLPLAPEADVTLLRAAQEALANIRKHAQARQVTVTLSYMEDQVILDVQDDGQGFDPTACLPQENAGGFGLTAMRQRVEQLGGTLSIESAPAQGSTLTVLLPLQD